MPGCGLARRARVRSSPKEPVHGPREDLGYPLGSQLATEVGSRNFGSPLWSKWEQEMEASIDGFGKTAIESVHPLAGTWTNFDKPRSAELLEVMADEGDAYLNVFRKCGDR